MKNGDLCLKQARKIFIVLTKLVLISSMALYPILFLYSKNVDEISIQSIGTPIRLFLSSMLLLYAIFVLLSRNNIRALFGTAIIMLLVMNFRGLEALGRKIFPAIRYWHILTVEILTALYIMRSKKLQEDILDKSTLLISSVFWGLIFLNIVPQVPDIIRENFEVKKLITMEASEELKDSPNVYYLVFDEYSSIDFMKKYYNYDNMEFAKYLEDKGFNVSYSSANEAYVTQICMTNILNLEYLYDMGMNGMPGMTESRHNNKAFDILRKQGYSIVGIGGPEFYGLSRVEGGEQVETSTMGGKSFEQLIVEKTVFYPFYFYDTSNKMQGIQASVRYLMSMDIDLNQGNFVLFHIEPSHTPFVMDELGQPVSSQYAQEWNDKRYYKGTYIYTTNLIKEITKGIIDRDPNSIIIVSSDHSARAAQSGFDNMFEEEDKCKIFNAVYYKGEYFDIEGLSATNTLRAIFNRLFDMEYKMIETYPLMPVEEYRKNE